MLIDAADPYNSHAELALFQNGGRWFFEHDFKKQQEFAFAMESLPFAIEVETASGKFGIVHSTVPYGDWDKFVECLSDVNVQRHAVWDRARHYDAQKLVVKGVDYVVVGHNMVTSPETLGNVINIDTGAVQLKRLAAFNKGFTLLNMTDFEFLQEVDYVVQ